jgi:hypothetical protein
MKNKLKNERKRKKLKDKAPKPILVETSRMKGKAPKPILVETITDDDDDSVINDMPDLQAGYESDDSDDESEIDEPDDIRIQLKAQQKPGVLFPNDSCSPKDLPPDLEAIALTQYNLKRGLKEFGDDGLEALGKEMEQLHTRKVAKPIDSDSLSQAEKKASLRYLMFLTKKRCGRIKARGCADG